MNTLFIFILMLGDNMIIRLGYACISVTLNNITPSTPYSYNAYLKSPDLEKLDTIIRSNLEALECLIDYNIQNHIHVFRLSSNIIPLATTPQFFYDYYTPYQDIYQRIAKKIKVNKLRVDFHPDQYTVLNSTKVEVIENTRRSLEYQYRLLDYLEVEQKLLLLHIGSSTFGKKQSIARFINQFKKLPSYIQECIAVENDDKIFTVEDTLFVAETLHIPMVLDYHHYLCNKELDITLFLERILKTWKGRTPKMHFSSPKSKLKKEFRSHHDYIQSNDFLTFLQVLQPLNCDIDIMIEAKKKDEALFRLIREIKYKTNYQFLDDTSFLI